VFKAKESRSSRDRSATKDPLLSKANLDRMRKEPPRNCPGCGAEVSRNYCRDCDVFFFDGHSQGCADTDARAHRGHPTYAGSSDTI